MLSDERVSSRTALVAYATETGTAQDLANEVGRILERHRFDVEIEEFDHVRLTSFHEYYLVVFVLSTTGQGDFPSNARSVWTALLRKKLTATFLKDLNYTIVGLGDSSYPKFNWAARKLHKRIQQLGAKSLLAPCEADEQGEDSTDGAFILWSNSFKAMLQTTFPLPTGEQPIPDDQSLPSRYVLSHFDPDKSRTFAGLKQSNSPKTTQDIQLKVTLELNERVTPQNHWQDVRFLRLKSSAATDYLPGDALAIKPQNISEDVQTLLETLHWQDVADSLLIIKLNRNTNRLLRLPNQALDGQEAFTLRELLTDQLDINAIPRRSFFGAIAQYTTNEMHKERLMEFTDPQYLDEYYDYATRPRRSILEILQEFDSVQIPWQEAINVFPFLRPRQFSIASGGRLKDHGNTFELLVAVVKYRTVIKRVRQGVCTRYLAQLPVGTVMNVVLKTEGRLHTAPQLCQVNHLLLGAGTGIAPLRAIVYEKRDSLSTRSSTLVFGCRNASADFFFKDEWAAIEQAATSEQTNQFELITAFSRDQLHKLYIQDRIRENASKIRHLLIDLSATIIVCGSSGAMPKAVRQALIDVLANGETHQSSMTPEEAETFLAKLEKEGRYKQETW